ncbi:caspase family protein [Runella sp.]|uniref:caspase family protein n=1 Tax=Runella sp. TaxID=1960881 RepID=UPI003D0FB424
MKLLPIFLLTLFVSKLSAQTTYAVVIGISDYKILDYRTGDLRYADEDARRFVAFLKSDAGGRVPSQNIILLTNQMASQSAIFTAMRIFQKASATDRIIFYFSGHGAENAFVPYDVKQNSYASLLTHAEIKAAFKESVASTKLVIADACFSGSMKPKKAIQRYKKTRDNSEGLNVAMILSSRSTQQSIEASQVNGGVFTYFLLTGLRGYADFNKDRMVTIKELYTYMAPRLKKSTSNGQAPVFSGKFSDNLVLSLVR